MTSLNDRRNAIIAAFLKARTQNALEPELGADTTRLLIRTLCLKKLEKGLSLQQLDAYQKYFEKLSATEEELQNYITKLDTEYFKAFWKFLKGEVKKPSHEITNLLAVLIDFDGKTEAHVPDDQKQIDPNWHDESATEENTNPKNSQRKISRKPSKWLSITAGITLPVAGVFFAMKEWKGQECMKWELDRYVACACSDHPQGQPIVIYDQYKIDHFRKITRADTLNYSDLRKVWYVKMNNQVEFFTEPGRHPLFPDRTLKSTTKYILDKYALNKP